MEVGEEQKCEEHTACERREVGEERNVSGEVNEHDLAMGFGCGGEMGEPESLEKGCEKESEYGIK